MVPDSLHHAQGAPTVDGELVGSKSFSGGWIWGFGSGRVWSVIAQPGQGAVPRPWAHYRSNECFSRYPTADVLLHRGRSLLNEALLRTRPLVHPHARGRRRRRARAWPNADPEVLEGTALSYNTGGGRPSRAGSRGRMSRFETHGRNKPPCSGRSVCRPVHVGLPPHISRGGGARTGVQIARVQALPRRLKYIFFRANVSFPLTCVPRPIYRGGTDSCTTPWVGNMNQKNAFERVIGGTRRGKCPSPARRGAPRIGGSGAPQGCCRTDLR